MKRENMLIEADELLAKVGDANLRIFDATILFFRQESDQTAYERYRERHIPGAAFFDHEALSDSSSSYMYMVLPEAELFARIGEIGISPDSEVIFYTYDLLPCATRAWWILHYAGHDNVRVLNGGLAAWEQAGGAVTQGGHQYAPAAYSGNLRSNLFASKEEVMTALADGKTCTVNTLTQEVYDQGHIKGTSLLPCGDLMREMAAFLPDELLSARLREEAQNERVITYCGGGIAATVNAMAHLMAGNENVAVYDGSMDEWAGEGLPIAGKPKP